MFIHNINPILLSLGPFSIRYYGIVYALGFVLIYFILSSAAKNNKIENLTSDNVDSFILYLILSVIIGGRLGEVLFYGLSYYLANPLQILMIWNGGMSFHGALLALIIVMYYYCKKHKIRFLQIADIVSIPAAFVLVLGRIANFINAELIGRPINSWYCIDYSKYGISDCRHPSQIYEALKNLVIGFILIIEKKFLYNKKFEGLIFYSFVTLYGLLRFLVTFYRDDPIVFIGLSTGQLFSFSMFLIGLGLIIYRIIKLKKIKK